ncbi:MAG: disulfide bond formation protein DsbA [Actinomycetota bacterium]
MTARWVVDEVAPARDLSITWQPISLLLKNDPDEDSPFREPVERTYKLLRVMESVRATEGEDAVFRLYWEYGRRIHHDQAFEFDPADALESAGLPTSHAAAFESDEFDDEIRRRHDEGIALAGEDIGTPIIAFDNRDGVKQAYFGPVITRVPSTEDSLAMWDALVAMMNIDGFWELKRTRTERPEFGERP